MKLGTKSAQKRALRAGSVKRRVEGGASPTQGGAMGLRSRDAGSSPFAPVLGPVESELPPVFCAQLLRPGDGIVLEGSMRRVWRRGRALRPLFSLLAHFDVLFPETGTDVPASLLIRPLAGGGHRWERTFVFPRPRHFDATLAFSPELGRIVELVGPGGCIEMAWDVRFEPPARLLVRTAGARLRVGRHAVPLPDALAPCVAVVQEATAEGELVVDLVVSHVAFGAIFGYDGRFHLRDA